ncbi:MAG: cytochrome b/b6 domain-containing protein [Anaerolineae bacterium]|nr:cytochrome b/b6 domain-containing protein [Anaerolineae bacterium]
MAAQKTYQRFNVTQRVEHWILLSSFTILAVTGLPQKYVGTGWAEGLIRLMGGIETVRSIHHIAAIVLMLESIYHITAVAYRVLVKRVRMSMLPVPRDLIDLIDAIRYNLGLAPKRPGLDRFSYEEKMEYWAVVWGTVIMAITGFMMWNPIATTRFFPGDFVPAAKAAHGGEALLAVLAIITWHFYNVHLRRLNRSIFTGKLSHEEMHEDHPLELARMEAGQNGPPLAPEVKARRERFFIPGAAILVILLLFGLYQFVTFEQTAITTLPQRATVIAFVPATATPTLVPTATPTRPPTATPTATFTPAPTATPTPSPLPTDTPLPGATNTPTSAATPTVVATPTTAATPTPAAPVVSFSKDVLPLFNASCNSCHGALGGLSLADYDAVMKGGAKGKSVVPGDPEGSLLVKRQREKHPANLTAEQLEVIIAWIKAGALNN